MKRIVNCISRFNRENRMALYYVETQDQWKETVQLAIKKIVRKAMGLKLEERTAGRVLVIIGETWSPIPKEQFPDLITYYTVLAKMTDHLLMLLTEECKHIEFLLANKKMILGFDQKQNVISFVYSMKEQEVHPYINNIISELPQFIQAPKQLQVICIESGTKYCYFPHTKEIRKVDVNSLINI